MTIDISDALITYHNCQFTLLGDDYNTLLWNDDNPLPKPTLNELLSKVTELNNTEPMRLLREERDKKLLETDKYAIIDWPHTNDTVKQSWLIYRQALRDLPSISSPQIDSNGKLTNITWPTSP
tara:strand:+ start:219 stop:587 length:369 start_codon:yes stop_codon:yes gene_type:complete